MSAGLSAPLPDRRWLLALVASAPLALLACGPNGVATRSAVGAPAAADAGADARQMGGSRVEAGGSTTTPGAQDAAADARATTPAVDGPVVDTGAGAGADAGPRVDTAVAEAGAPPPADAASAPMPAPMVDARVDVAPMKDTAPPDLATPDLAPPAAPIALMATADTYGRDGVSPEGASYRTANFGAEPFLYAKRATEVDFNRDAFVRFVAPQTVPPMLAKAELRLNLHSFMNAEDIVLAVHELSGDWTETALTYANRPARGAELARTTVRGTTVREYVVDVTAYVRRRLAAGQREIEFALVTPNISMEAIRGPSRESGATGPRLIVTP